MRTKGQLFAHTGDALARVTTDGWDSRAAEMFREKFDAEPGRWRDAGSDWQRAAAALEDWADALDDAKRRADWARREYARGDQVTRDARSAYDADVSRARSEAAQQEAAGYTVNLTILPFHDPGERVRQGALHEYAAAKADLDGAADACAAGVRAGCTHAPAKRNWLEKAGGAVAGFFKGAGEALLDLGKLAAFLAMPEVVIPMMLMDDLASGLTPEEIAAKYRLKLEDAVDIAKFAGEHPLEFGKTLGKAILDWDTWKDDPARAAGHLLPDAVIAVLTAGSGTVATRGAKAMTDGLDALRAVDRLDDLSGLRHLDDVPGSHTIDNFEALHRFDDVPTGPQGTWRTLDDPDLEPWLDEVTRAHPELDRDGLRGVWDYTTDNGYDTMNRAMRGQIPIDGAIQDRVSATTRGLDQLPAYEGTTYRGTDVPQFKLDELTSTGRYYDDAFTSSSLNPHTAEGFIRADAQNPTFFTIDGRSGVNVQPFSAAQHEAEILFKGGREFEVVTNVVRPDGIRHVVLRELP